MNEPRAKMDIHVNPRKRKLSNVDVAGARWFLSGAMSMAVFVTFVQHFFSREWFDFLAIAFFTGSAIVSGWLFSELWILLFMSTVGVKERVVVQTTDSASSIDSFIVEPTQLTWLEHAHIAAIALVGVRWNALRATCLALIVVAPTVVYAMKARSEDIDSTSSTALAVTFGMMSIVAIVMVAIALLALSQMIAARMKGTRTAYLISDDGVQWLIDEKQKKFTRWNEAERLIQTSKIIAIESQTKLVLVAPRRTINEARTRSIEAKLEQYEAYDSR